MVTKKEKFDNLYKFERAHVKNGILKCNNKDQETYENLLQALTDKELDQYERQR